MISYYESFKTKIYQRNAKNSIKEFNVCDNELEVYYTYDYFEVIPLLPEEVDKILGSMGMSRIDVSKELETGKKVKILNGPFQNMEGTVESVDLKTQKVNLSVDLFGQETKVEVDMKDISGLE